MDTISFIGNEEPPERLLEMFKRFTPGCSGVWGNLKGEPHYDTKYYAVIDYLPRELKNVIDESKCVYLGAHPETLRRYYNMDNYKGLKMYDCKNSFGFGEFWINYTYDELMALERPTKTKILGSIVSNSQIDPSHTDRRNFLDRFCTTYPDMDFNLHGRIQPWGSLTKFYKGVCGSSDNRGAKATGGKNNHMIGKEQVYLDHKYMLEFDNYGEYYFSERIFDCVCLWSMPIYKGGNRLHEYIGENAFRYFDIKGNGKDVLDIVKSNFYEEHIDDLAQARQLLLNNFHIWPRVHEAIYGINK